MFPIHFKLTIGTPEELARITAFIAGDYSAAVAAAPKLDATTGNAQSSASSAGARKPAASATAGSQQGTASAGEAPGKPKPTAASEPATPAPSPRTAEAAVDAAPAQSTPQPEPQATTEAPAAANSAADAPAFEYATLQKAVNERVAKVGKDKLLAVATKHGAKTFKDLPADKWALAHADVIALG